MVKYHGCRFLRTTLALCLCIGLSITPMCIHVGRKVTRLSYNSVNMDHQVQLLSGIKDTFPDKTHPPNDGSRHHLKKLTSKYLITRTPTLNPVNGDINDPSKKNFTNAPWQRTGDLGKGVNINVSELSADDLKLYNKLWRLNSFSQFTSDLISVHRRLPDYRDPRCASYGYRPLSVLPSTSVIIIFLNEAWSTLVRTVHSVIDNSPEHLIQDIILVDDRSTHSDLLGKLDVYFKEHDKVRILRNDRRQGLARARMIGASSATGKVLVFLDSHCECTQGWLIPLLDRIADSESNVVCPIIDVIDGKTFEYLNRSSNPVYVGGFNWNMTFDWHREPQGDLEQKNQPTDPTKSPTMAGGLFAISKRYFFKFGGYDPGLRFWGGEHLELSFKIWMCGGRLEVIPCSHVGHVFRRFIPYTVPGGHANLARNNARVAEVWMDEYKAYYYQRLSKLPRAGDISKQLQIRKELNCHNFDWYLQYVYPTQWDPKESLYVGEIRNAHHDACVTSQSAPLEEIVGSRVTAGPCFKSNSTKYWYMTRGKEIRKDDACFAHLMRKDSVIIYKCDKKSQQLFRYTENGQIIGSGSGKCLTITSRKMLVMKKCRGQPGQLWIWSKANSNP